MSVTLIASVRKNTVGSKKDWPSEGVDEERERERWVEAATRNDTAKRSACMILQAITL